MESMPEISQLNHYWENETTFIRLSYSEILIRRKKSNTRGQEQIFVFSAVSYGNFFFPDKSKILKAQQKFIPELWGRQVTTWILIPQRNMHGGSPAFRAGNEQHRHFQLFASTV